MGFTNRPKNAKEDWQVLIQRSCFKTSYSTTMISLSATLKLPLTFLERKLMMVPFVIECVTYIKVLVKLLSAIKC